MATELTCREVAPCQHLFIEDGGVTMVRALDAPYLTDLDGFVTRVGKKCIEMIKRRLPVFLMKSCTMRTDEGERVRIG